MLPTRNLSTLFNWSYFLNSQLRSSALLLLYQSRANGTIKFKCENRSVRSSTISAKIEACNSELLRFPKQFERFCFDFRSEKIAMQHSLV